MAKQSGSTGRRRSTVNQHTNGSIRLHSSLADRHKAKKQSRAAARAEYLSTLPKERWKRLLYRLQPKRVAAYWFSREGGIMALKIVGISIVVCFFFTVGLFAYFRKDLPKIKDISGTNLGGSITYYDRTGQTVLWQDYDAVKRIPVQNDQISDYLKHATVSIEDKNFYTEGAFDVRGIMRAAVTDVTGSGNTLQGGSTITQQLVKLNENWTNDHTISRKVKELILAVEMEREYSKSEILTGYLNMAPYGGIEYGAEAAARDYFQTDANNLTLPQAAMLAAIPKSPSRFSPYSSPQFNSSASGDLFDAQGLLNRQHYILDLMAQQGYITKDQAAAAKQVDVLSQVHPLTSKYNNIKAPYFVLAAKQELEDKYGAQTVQRGGWKVITTLNVDLQNTAESIAAKNLPNVKRYGGDEEAMAAEDVKTGQMVALVGGVDFNDPDHGQINYAQINISPGSSFKPYDYSTFIENHTDAGAGSVMYDVQQPLPGYPCTDKNRPKNDDNANCLWDYDFNYPGAVSIRYGLAGSRNVPAVKAMLSAVPNDKSQDRTKSINKVISTANAMIGDDNAYKCFKPGTNVETGGKSEQAQCFGSSAIGDGAYLHLDEHVNGLSTLARLGAQIPQTYILQITDSANKTIYKWTQPKAKQVIHQDTAFIVDDMLSDPRASYLSSQYKIQNWNGWRIAVKTGTTNDNYDGLMTAWSTQYAIASWVGYHDRNKAMTGGHMEYMTAPLTQGWIKDALGKLNTKPVNWQKPSDIKTLPSYVQRTHVGDRSIEPGPSEDYFPSWYVGNKSGGSTSAVIDRVSGGLATSCTPDDAKQTVGGGNANSFDADEFYPIGQSSSSSVTTAISDNVHNCDDPPLPSPTVTPNACSVGQSCLVTVVVSSSGAHPLSGGTYGGTVQVSINGTDIGTQNISDPNSQTLYFNYTPSSPGSLQVTATVTDSVLYQATGSATMEVSPATTTTGYIQQNSATNHLASHQQRQTTSGGTGSGGGRQPRFTDSRI
jgi:membrane peptidoglycan carboxypeptidase